MNNGNKTMQKVVFPYEIGVWAPILNITKGTHLILGSGGQFSLQEVHIK